MEEKTNQTQSAVFNYTAPRAVRIGDVFYRIESGESVYFREPCKVCGGTGQLTVRGVTFKCPCCDTQKRLSAHTSMLCVGTAFTRSRRRRAQASGNRAITKM